MYLVARDASQLPSSVINLVLAAGVSLPRQGVHTRTADAQDPQRKRRKESHTARYERGDKHSSKSREDSGFVEEVAHFDPADAVFSQAWWLHDHHGKALIQSGFKLALQGRLVCVREPILETVYHCVLCRVQQYSRMYK